MSRTGVPAIIAISGAMKRAVDLLERFAQTRLAILLVGATGTGKELFARHVHYRSRRHGAFVDLNCGALPHEMMESLLFGHRRGAFTGAIENTVGYIERADGGTLFLDELLHLSAAGQVKLLRVLENNEVERLGEGQKRFVDLRVVAAVQEDTPQRLDAGLFRHDLFQRLAGIVIDLPLLADRPEDIVPLAEHFAAAGGQRLEEGTAAVLEGHAWPGNVRELRLAIERAGCLVQNGTLPPGALRDAIALGMLSDRRQTDRRRRDWERRITKPPCSWDDLVKACEAHAGNPERVAASLGIRRSALYERLKAAGISLNSFRKSGRPPDVRPTSTGMPESATSTIS
ncbi:MAG TPA: sigma 54-interacting transcriptional regulator [Gemmatimonadales bacterium]|jgi:DNA-binding NtrC family response regulator|nr:sigma 54-interacting transcriptional regulator [Gemmatimonadales bacterium]